MKTLVSLIGSFTLILSLGCAMCADPHDCKYASYGGAYQRTDMVNGRVGSVLGPASTADVGDWDKLEEVEPQNGEPTPALEDIPESGELTESDLVDPQSADAESDDSEDVDAGVTIDEADEPDAMESDPLEGFDASEDVVPENDPNEDPSDNLSEIFPELSDEKETTEQENSSDEDSAPSVEDIFGDIPSDQT